jgi:Zn-dependent protease with chaperone function
MLPVHGLHGHIENTGLRSVILFLGFALTLCLIWPAVYITACLIGGLVLPILSIFLMMVPPIAKPLAMLGGFCTKSLVAALGSPTILLTTLYIPLTVAVLWLVIGIWAHRDIIQLTTRSHPVQRRDEPLLFNLVENLTITAGVPVPRIDIMETDARNAFAIGWTPDDTTITVTRGLLNALSKDELEAVLAHELAHIINRDSRINLLAAVLNGLLVACANRIWSKYTFHPSALEDIFLIRGDEDDQPQAIIHQRRRIHGFMVLHGAPTVMMFAGGIDPDFGRIVGVFSFVLLGWLVKGYVIDWWQGRSDEADFNVSFLPSTWLIIFLPFWLAMVFLGFFAALAYSLSAWLTASISQARELLADAVAITLTKDPEALCAALRKVSGHEDVGNAATMAMMISSRRGGVFRTHPPIQQRLEAIRRYALAAGLPTTKAMPAETVATTPSAFGKRATTQVAPATPYRLRSPGLVVRAKT